MECILIGGAAAVARGASRLTQDIDVSTRAPPSTCGASWRLLAPSIKAGLDIDWSDPKQKAAAIKEVERQVASLERWVQKHLETIATPLSPYLEALTVVRAQDLEPALSRSPNRHKPRWKQAFWHRDREGAVQAALAAHTAPSRSRCQDACFSR